MFLVKVSSIGSKSQRFKIDQKYEKEYIYFANTYYFCKTCSQNSKRSYIYFV